MAAAADMIMADAQSKVSRLHFLWKPRPVGTVAGIYAVFQQPHSDEMLVRDKPHRQLMVAALACTSPVAATQL